jgi:hypothetical protein
VRRARVQVEGLTAAAQARGWHRAARLPDVLIQVCTLNAVTTAVGTACCPNTIVVISEGRGYMATGMAKWFNDAKGYGFSTSDDGEEELFAHFLAMRLNSNR